MEISEAKLAANRANAQKSTGPTTIEGREKSSQNRLVHGLTGKFRVLSWESQADYDALLEGLMRAEKPADEAETELVGKMARFTWLANRALTLQETCFSNQPTSPEDEARGKQAIGIRTDLDSLLRYHTTNDRAYRRASQELLQRRKQREASERGFESQKRAEADRERRENREARQAERHQAAMATHRLRQQREEIRTTKEFIDSLPADLFKNHPEAATEASAILQNLGLPAAGARS